MIQIDDFAKAIAFAWWLIFKMVSILESKRSFVFKRGKREVFEGIRSVSKKLAKLFDLMYLLVSARKVIIPES